MARAALLVQRALGYDRNPLSSSCLCCCRPLPASPRQRCSRVNFSSAPLPSFSAPSFPRQPPFRAWGRTPRPVLLSYRSIISRAFPYTPCRTVDRACVVICHTVLDQFLMSLSADGLCTLRGSIL
eukprot:8471444-Pyramimonas_sp.AAC.1